MAMIGLAGERESRVYKVNRVNKVYKVKKEKAVCYAFSFFIFTGLSFIRGHSCIVLRREYSSLFF
jgi:hypothetical protein